MLQVTNSPFRQDQVELLNLLLPTLTEGQKIWLGGYLAAFQSAGEQVAAALQEAEAQAASAPAAPQEVTVLFGSQTGNSHKLAKKLSGRLQDQGAQVTLSAMIDFKPNTLKKVQHLVIIVSTHGEGDPPDNAISFYEFLHSKRAPQLEGMPFTVLALGDTSYELFCKTGRDFDQRLEELGGKRLAPRVDCDVDYDESAENWMAGVLAYFGQASASASAQTSKAADPSAVGAGQLTEYSRSRPFQADVLENLNLNGRGSEQETRHLELALADSGLRYEPGDSLGIYPRNHPRLVDELIEAMGWQSDVRVVLPKSTEERSLKEALTSHCEITVLTKPLIEQVAELAPGNGLKDWLLSSEEQDIRAYLKGRDLLDLAQDYDWTGVTANSFVSLLRKMPPRLYSIASSLKSFPEEVHLTIRNVRYEAHGRVRYGVCSTFVSEQLEPGETVPVFVQDNPNFKLPSNPDTPVIMIGPGTGVAPFRAFLGEREELGAEGKTWLFYGDRHFSSDFLYQVEWQRWLKEGVLTRMDVAFSRDTEQKVYVQHRMMEKSKELYQWIEEGAAVYVCGDEKKMAHDVQAALIAILKQEGGLGDEDAAAYLTKMQQEKRYQRDVY
ncbi:assimilatory sulfite reductase (NADPH) flavoprotein subunit [Paenibacillus sacheonensis]|uniref:assimilatory sulfite reductase (NADPH) n=1 Tax=Paenibacillus sacheonensis TaxID=742054 RepID=A0A7X5BXK0_9BACL|nr:assimilatory sulfite reductase (NADPH) flavoprotein subunit [Paenibacillus sacheonensis]MBM7566409.1 sulfite reductase (NADPH) flavoprotein alpha-component [Paenibacillus sacheonensis]NBC70608.1 assimilatory sulfite reductase (NADPH) flavoprotein subunit [Paenibacillus sacheonensis]